MHPCRGAPAIALLFAWCTGCGCRFDPAEDRSASAPTRPDRSGGAASNPAEAAPEEPVAAPPRVLRTVRLPNPVDHVVALDCGPAKITALAFSPGGSLLGVGAQDGSIRVVDAIDGRLLRAIDDQRLRDKPIRGLAFLHSGELLAAGEAGVFGWNLIDRNALGAHHGLEGTTAMDVHLRRIAADKRDPLLGYLGAPVRALAFSRDGKSLIALAATPGNSFRPAWGLSATWTLPEK